MAPEPRETAEAVGSAEPAGNRLRRLREEAGLSVNELAQRLRLSPAMLAAIEADDDAKLPESAFVRGYIRSIAKELGTDPAPILELYYGNRDVAPPALADFKSRAPIQATSDSGLVKITTYVIAGLLVVLTLAWWQNDAPEPPADVAETMEQVEAEIYPDRGTPLPYQFDIIGHEDRWDYRPSEQEIETLRSANTAAAAADSADAVQPRPTTTNEGTIAFETRADAWVSITDAAGDRLYYRTAAAGTSASVSGEAPFELVIGNSRAVNLRFRGDPVDLAPYDREGVARLTLD